MMPVVRISDATFGDLKTIATWTEEATPGAVIARLVKDALEELDLAPEASSETEAGASEAKESQERLEFSETPGLTHTKIERASIGGRDLEKPNWSKLLIAVVAHLKSLGLSGKELVHALNVNASKSKLYETGYRFHPELGISVQGQSAQDSWREVERLAQKYSIGVEVDFRWSNKVGAAHPGRAGLLRV